MIYRGNYVLLAAFISGRLFEPFYKKMGDFVEDLEKLFAGELENWTGSIEAFPDIKVVLESLL